MTSGLTKKILIVGDNESGKMSLFHRFSTGHFPPLERLPLIDRRPFSQGNTKQLKIFGKQVFVFLILELKILV